MVSAANAGCASAKTAAPASQNAVFIFTPLPRYQNNPASQVAARSGSVIRAPRAYNE
jgi:hypothetical protein